MPQTNNQESTARRESEMAHPFVTDIAEIRRRARRHIRDGAVASGYAADRETVLRLLNEALATELVCVLRYRRHYFMAGGAVAEAIKDELLRRANEEQGHADQLAQRIVELGGAPNLSPEAISEHSHSEYVEGETLAEMLAEDLIAERIAIESYREVIQYLGTNDSTTRQLFESILAVEEEHAEDIRSMREDMLRRDRGGNTAHDGAARAPELQ